MQLNYKFIGALRGLGVVVLIAVLGWAQQATNLSFIGNPIVISLVVAIAGAIEHSLEEKNGTALLGLAKVN